MRALVILLCIIVPPSVANAVPPEVVAVYPSADAVPENLLRISIAFRTAPGPGLLREIGLHDADGTAIDRPFLDQELWSPDGSILTILLHPGRVKGGLTARDRAGPPIRRGHEVALRLDGRPIKLWRVDPPQLTAPDPAKWTVRPPRAGTRDPVSVGFDAPIDFMAVEYIVAVTPNDAKMAGRVALAAGERGWALTPKEAWGCGRYRLLVHPRLEDPQGNALRSRFEQPGRQAVPDAARPAELIFVIPEGSPARASPTALPQPARNARPL